MQTSQFIRLNMLELRLLQVVERLRQIVELLQQLKFWLDLHRSVSMPKLMCFTPLWLIRPGNSLVITTKLD